MSPAESSRKHVPIAVRRALVLSITLLAACNGGNTPSSASTHSQCESAVRDLGIGYSGPPNNEAERDAQVALISKALGSWETTRATVTLPGVHERAIAIAAALTERKSLLGASQIDSAARSALDANMRKYSATIGELAAYCAEHAR